MDNGESIKVNKKSFRMRLHSDTRENSVDMERRSTEESDCKSQLSTQELVI